ncbi:pentapeptide repeat-containing protein [Streptomyces sp. NPDC050433]|uniref:pentapeptide repeat-containing protein n=1 Tax=unclassified Streptomyces TaxID=2593676 RepID=UPI00341CB849
MPVCLPRLPVARRPRGFHRRGRPRRDSGRHLPTGPSCRRTPRTRPPVRKLGSGAALGGATLSRTTLANADLTGAGLSEAGLSGADLLNADLSGAENLTKEQVDSARVDGTTRLPASLS